MPTLEDYSHGVSEATRGIREYFFEGEERSSPAPECLGNGEGAGPLADLSRRWRRACTSRCTSEFRIIDLQKKSSSALTVRLEVRLEGWRDPERVAALALFDLDFERPADAAPWTLRASRAVGGPAAIQNGFPHLFEEAAARGLGVTNEALDPVEATNLVFPRPTTTPACCSWTSTPMAPPT